MNSGALCTYDPLSLHLREKKTKEEKNETAFYICEPLCTNTFACQSAKTKEKQSVVRNERKKVNCAGKETRKWNDLDKCDAHAPSRIEQKRTISFRKHLTKSDEQRRMCVCFVWWKMRRNVRIWGKKSDDEEKERWKNNKKNA